MYCEPAFVIEGSHLGPIDRRLLPITSATRFGSASPVLFVAFQCTRWYLGVKGHADSQCWRGWWPRLATRWTRRHDHQENPHSFRLPLVQKFGEWQSANRYLLRL